MEDWSNWSDEQVFGQVGEEPGSIAAHRRETEIKRRLYIQQSELLKAQYEAAIQQARAADEMRRQSRYLFWSTIGIFVAAVATFTAAIATFMAMPG